MKTLLRGDSARLWVGGGGDGDLSPQITPRSHLGHFRATSKLLMSLRKNGRREWDRTTDHHHVKVMLYH